MARTYAAYGQLKRGMEALLALYHTDNRENLLVEKDWKMIGEAVTKVLSCFADTKDFWAHYELVSKVGEITRLHMASSLKNFPVLKEDLLFLKSIFDKLNECVKAGQYRILKILKIKEELTARVLLIDEDGEIPDEERNSIIPESVFEDCLVHSLKTGEPQSREYGAVKVVAQSHRFYELELTYQHRPDDAQDEQSASVERKNIIADYNPFYNLVETGNPTEQSDPSEPSYPTWRVPSPPRLPSALLDPSEPSAPEANIPESRVPLKVDSPFLTNKNLAPGNRLQLSDQIDPNHFRQPEPIYDLAFMLFETRTPGAIIHLPYHLFRDWPANFKDIIRNLIAYFSIALEGFAQLKC